jgi:hypothetical protein
VNWVASGRTVMLVTSASLTGTGGTTTMTMTGLPAFLCPVTAQTVMCSVVNNSVSAGGTGYMTVSTAGVVTVYPTIAAGAWTASGTKAILPTPISWPYA